MWFVWTLLGSIGGLLAVAAGAVGMRWYVERNRVIAEREDPRDTQLRELLAEIKLRRADTTSAQQALEDANTDAAGLRHSLKEAESCAASLKAELEKREATLETENRERAATTEALERLRRENDTLKSRVQELEMEISMGHSNDMLDPELQSTSRC